MNDKRIEELRCLLAGPCEPAQRLAYLLELARDLNYVQPAEGVRVAREAVALSRELADQRGLASSLVTLGGNLAAAGQGDEALATLSEGRVLCESMGDDAGVVRALSSSGYVYKNTGRFDDAVLMFRRALSGPVARVPAEVHAPVFSSLGHVYAELGQVPSAVMCLTQALDLHVTELSSGMTNAAGRSVAAGASMTNFTIEEAVAQSESRIACAGDMVRLIVRQAPQWRAQNSPLLRPAIRFAGVLSDLGWLWSVDARNGSGLDDAGLQRDRLRRAQRWLRLARRAFEATGLQLGIFTAEGNVAEVWLLLGRYRMAEALLTSRAPRIQALNTRLLWRLWSLAGAEAALALGKPQAALDWLQPFAEEHGADDSQPQADTFDKLTRIHLQLGDTVAARHWLDASDRARRRLHRRALLQSGRLFAAELQLVTLQAQMQALGRRAEDLDRRANQDGLTGLWNRTYFDVKLDEAVRHARSQGAPLALMMVDIDHFKRINDGYSHLAGDQVLQRVAREAERCFRLAHDTVARFGGEEFVVLAPGLPFETALRVAQRVCDAVRRLSWPDIDPSMVVTVSIGVAQWAPDMSARDLIESADQQLYAAKRAGRDRFMPAPPKASVEGDPAPALP
jgi:diguanylate cyclase (GGDEF)-like protein